MACVLSLSVSYFYYPTIPFSSVYFLFAPFSDDPEVFFPEYSKPAILHAAHFRRVVTDETILNS